MTLPEKPVEHVRAERAFRVGQSLLDRGEEDRAYDFIKAAAEMRHRQAQLYFGAKTLDQKNCALAAEYFMMALGQTTDRPDTFSLPQLDTVQNIIKCQPTHETYSTAMRTNPYTHQSNNAACFINSAAALLTDPTHPLAGNVACNLSCLLLRINKIVSEPTGIKAQMTDHSTIPLDAIPSAFKALTAYRRVRSLLIQYPSPTALEMKG